ncbi:MAG: hypothetical protein V4622_02010 [Bacteroidota bacterium]
MSILKKTIIYFFIFGITFPSELNHVISFIPEFINHYQHHNSEHHQLSLIEFISEHATGTHHEENHEQHEQDKCPVSHNHNVVTIDLVINETFRVNFKPEEFFNDEARLKSFPENQFCSSKFTSSIWQPPKFS